MRVSSFDEVVGEGGVEEEEDDDEEARWRLSSVDVALAAAAAFPTASTPVIDADGGRLPVAEEEEEDEVAEVAAAAASESNGDANDSALYRTNSWHCASSPRCPKNSAPVSAIE